MTPFETDLIAPTSGPLDILPGGPGTSAGDLTIVDLGPGVTLSPDVFSPLFPAGEALIYTFDTDAQGWTADADARSFDWNANDGDGTVVGVDGVSGDTWYFVAPEEMLGDQSGRYGFSLVFDLKQSATSSQFDDTGVILTGPAGTLTYDTAENPGTDFTSYNIPMLPAGWTFTAPGGTAAPATETDMRAVLGNLDSVQIRGEYRAGSDNAALDNAGWSGGESGSGGSGGGETLFYTFDSDAQGWMTNGDTRSFDWQDGGGDGNVRGVDAEIGGVWYFVAPEEMLGDRSAQYGNSLVFDMKQERTSNQFDADDVVLTGSAGKLVYDTAENPGLEFTSYDIEMVADGWTFTETGGTARDATEADMRAVLADLEGLELRGEYKGFEDAAVLDNVGWVGSGDTNQTGTGAADAIFGGNGNDIVDAGAGDDTVRLFGGGDTVDGGAGTDTVVYDTDRDGITYDASASGTITVMADGDPSDRLTNVERIELTDGAFVFDLDGDSLDFVYRMYDAAFARTPDEAGLRYWNGQVEDGAVAAGDLADAFTASTEFAEKYGANPTDEAYIDALYENALRRPADDGGYDFWLGVFESGALDREDMLEQFADSPENIARNVDNLDEGVWVI